MKAAILLIVGLMILESVIGATAPNIQSGTESFGTQTSCNQNLVSGIKGTRREVRRVNFLRPYPYPPKVSVSLAGLDNLKETNLRVITYAKAVLGFDLVVETWLWTKLCSATASWIAYND